MKNKVYTLIFKYALFPILIIAIVGGTSFWITKEQTINSIVKRNSVDFAEMAQSIAQKNFTFDTLRSLKLSGDIEKFKKDLQSLPRIKEIKILDANGIVIDSNSKEEIGQSFSESPNITKAIAGNITSDYKEGQNSIEIIVPIRHESGTRGIVILKTEPPLSLAEATPYATRLSIFLTLTTGLLIGLTYLSFSSAKSDMLEKDRSLDDKSRALEEEKQLDEAIMTSVAESLIVLNKEGQILVFNPEAERITGIKAAGIELRHYGKSLVFYDKEGLKRTENPIEECLKTGQKIQKNIKDGFFLKNSSKDLIPIAISVAPILNKDKSIRGVVATITDITAEKELDKVKDEFVYVVAHELGNPIFALDGYLSILEGQLPKTAKRDKEILALAQGVNRQLSGLVNDLLEVVRNEQGTLTCELSKINLQEIINEVLKNTQFKADGKKIKLIYESAKIPQVIGNEQKIKEVVTNLVDNAVKYTPEGGKVEISHSLSEGGLTTTVRDNGYGISPTEAEHLFEKFYRVKNKNTEGISGTGLGLFICKQIIEKCNGKMWAESTEGKGSSFFFTLKSA